MTLIEQALILAHCRRRHPEHLALKWQDGEIVTRNANNAPWRTLYTPTEVEALARELRAA